MTAPASSQAAPTGAEFTEGELCVAVELLDRHELESLIRQIYAADGGLH